MQRQLQVFAISFLASVVIGVLIHLIFDTPWITFLLNNLVIAGLVTLVSSRRRPKVKQDTAPPNSTPLA
jgi:uncharacterized membrane protein